MLLFVIQLMTVPHEKIRFVYPIRSSSIHNLKVSVHRRMDRLGLSDKLRAEVRKGKVGRKIAMTIEKCRMRISHLS